jgi:hypothetical protein
LDAGAEKAAAFGRCFRGALTGLAKPYLEGGGIGGVNNAETWRSSSADLVFISAGLPPGKSAFRPSCAALRPSLVEKSATTALIRPFALESVATFVNAAPPANASF